MSDQRNPTVLYAHRGAAAELPENTMAAFRRAIEVGAHALETDAHMTRDGHIVVSHDPTGLRMAGVSARFRDVTLAQVEGWDAGYGFVDPDGHRPFANKGHRVPTLERLLVELPGVPLNLDIKQSRPSMVAILLALLQRLDACDRVTLASFDTRTMVAVRRLGYPGPTSMSTGEVLSFMALPRPAWRTLWQRLGGIPSAAQLPTHQGPMRFDTPARIRALHDQGLRVEFWTIDDPTEARRLLDLGADGIMTNDPAAIRPVFDAWSERHG